MHGPSTFALSGYPANGTLSGAGSKSLNGKVIVSLAFENVRPADVVWGAVEQTPGLAWDWYYTRVSYPPLVVLGP